MKLNKHHTEGMKNYVTRLFMIYVELQLQRAKSFKYKKKIEIKCKSFEQLT